MRLIFLSVDLDVDARWDLGLPHTFHQLSEAAEEGLIDVLLGGPPARLGAAQGSCRHRVLDRSGTVASIAGAFPGLRRLSKRVLMRPTPWPSTSSRGARRSAFGVVLQLSSTRKTPVSIRSPPSSTRLSSSSGRRRSAQCARTLINACAEARLARAPQFQALLKDFPSSTTFAATATTLTSGLSEYTKEYISRDGYNRTLQASVKFWQHASSPPCAASRPTEVGPPAGRERPCLRLGFLLGRRLRQRRVPAASPC